ncbi:MAG: hypothetical protein AB7H80_05405, partial [Candidatus Kapaibacterium sp.]
MHKIFAEVWAGEKRTLPPALLFTLSFTTFVCHVEQSQEEKSTRLSRFPIGRLLQVVLAIGGITFFTLLARDVNFGALPPASL